jgi:hypothetical protein
MVVVRDIAQAPVEDHVFNIINIIYTASVWISLLPCGSAAFFFGMPVCQRQKDIEHHVGIAGKSDQTVATWSPLARDQYFTVRSLAPVQRMADLIARWVDPSSSCSAIAIARR